MRRNVGLPVERGVQGGNSRAQVEHMDWGHLGKDCILLDRENSPLPLLLEAGPVVDSSSGSEMGMVSKLSSMAICLKSKIPLPPSVILKGFVIEKGRFRAARAAKTLGLCCSMVLFENSKWVNPFRVDQEQTYGNTWKAGDTYSIQKKKIYKDGGGRFKNISHIKNLFKITLLSANKFLISVPICKAKFGKILLENIAMHARTSHWPRRLLHGSFF